MKLKFILFLIVLLLLIINASKNVYLLSDFEFLKGESISYNLGALSGKIINVFGVLALVKFCFGQIKSKKINSKNQFIKLKADV